MIHSRRLQQVFLRQTINSLTRKSIKRAGPTFQYLSVRQFSDSNNNESGNLNSTDSSSVLDKIQGSIDAVQNVIDEKVVDATIAVGDSLVEPPGLVVGKIMEAIDWVHSAAGVPYWEAIIISTIAVRFLMLPIAIKTVQGTARMAVMRPEMQKLQDAMNSDQNLNDIQTKTRYANEMKALFKKHQVNPLRAVMWPFFQFPIFIAFFMALKDMGLHYPGLATGGAFWFENLAAADPFYALPIINAVSFLIMIELGAQDGIQMEQAKTFKNVMRGLAVVMIPATMSMPQGLFIYWGANNVFSIAQTYLTKNEKFRAFFNIPKIPKPEDTPMFKPKSPIQAIKEMMESQKERDANLKAEFIDGKTVPKPPTTPPPVTFSAPPKKKKT